MLKHTGLMLPAHNYENRVMALVWSFDGLTLAAALADNTIYILYCGMMKHLIRTKYPNPEDGKSDDLIKAVAFSPDSTKLAVAHACGIVCVYKLENDWTSDAVLCNEFIQNSSVTCLVWPTRGPIVFGLENGKVRAAQLETEMVWTLYSTDSSTIALAVNESETSILSSHVDGSIFLCNFTDDNLTNTANRILTDLISPQIIGWAKNDILTGGHNQVVVFYDNCGKLLKSFDYSQELTTEDTSNTCCSFNGQNIAVGLSGKVHLYAWNSKNNCWEEIDSSVTNIFETVTAVALKNDGTKLVIGDIYGSVAEFKVIPHMSSSVNGDHQSAHVQPGHVTIALSTDKHSSSGGMLIRNVDINLVSEISLENDNGLPGSMIWPAIDKWKIDNSDSAQTLSSPKKYFKKPTNHRIKNEKSQKQDEIMTAATTTSISSLMIIEPKNQSQMPSNFSTWRESGIEKANATRTKITLRGKPSTNQEREKKTELFTELIVSGKQNNEIDYISSDIGTNSRNSAQSSITMELDSMLLSERSDDEINVTMEDSAVASRGNNKRKTKIHRPDSSELFHFTIPTPSAASGMLFQNLNEIPYDPVVDPPCWKTEDIRKSCSDADRIFCRNCGRLDVSMKDCPRCKDAYRLLTRRMSNEYAVPEASAVITSPIHFTRQYTPEELRADFTLQLALLVSLPPGLQRILEQHMLNAKKNQSCS